jgi:circadian clock protein KaiC
VIFLDHRVTDQTATRRLRVVKYRGSAHGTSEYPTMIDERGLSVLPVSSLGLDYPVTSERVSSGIAEMDQMLGGAGYYRGSSVLISGTAGTGKTSFSMAFAEGACRLDERCLYLAFEEAPAQIVRNMASIGYDAGKWIGKGLLRCHAVRSTYYGLEQHLVSIHKLVQDFKPAVVVFDPITNLNSVGDRAEVQSLLTRVIDFLKIEGITTLFTSLTSGGSAIEQSEAEVSSLMDTWLLLRNLETDGDRKRLIYVLKSRGMAHSSQVRGFDITDNGIRISPAHSISKPV